ncbi:MAG: hypothetical protein CMJ64_03220 [Planctomycetaceae bacterium]|nr:hypothetical protein [Planctomycetaceae bacterium]
MKVVLSVVQGPCQGQRFEFTKHDTFIVGRGRRAHCQLPAKDVYFSRIHFLVEVNPPRCRLMDMGSTNGTLVNGERVSACELKEGDVISGGDSFFEVSIDFSDSSVLMLPPATDLVPNYAGPPPVMASTLEYAAPVSSAFDPPEPSNACPLCGVAMSAQGGGGTAQLGETPLPYCRNCQSEIEKHEACARELSIEGYRIAWKIGQGGMRVVHLAWWESGMCPVAIKTVIPAVSGSPAEMDRFIREAKVLHELDHPSIVSLVDMGNSGGTFYFAMDYIRGQDATRFSRPKVRCQSRAQYA